MYCHPITINNEAARGWRIGQVGIYIYIIILRSSGAKQCGGEAMHLAIPAGMRARVDQMR